jgi:methylated-DNA-[protein]-cysteine S-methyltransferase
LDISLRKKQSNPFRIIWKIEKQREIDSKITMKGTKLQVKIWKELQKIPYGKTKSYGDIAKIVKTSPRYVGNVCGQNNHLLLVPCHRIIRGDGNLGGFSGLGGLTLKKRLLDLEQSIDK